MQLAELVEGETYSHDQVGAAFSMKPAVLSWQGGIISRPQHEALLVITKHDLASIDYADYWDGPDLVYTGQGQRGDHQMTRENRLLAQNSKKNHVFEALGSRMMRYRGVASTSAHWWSTGRDADGAMRNVIRYLLRFGPPIPTEADDAVNDRGGTEGARRERRHFYIERNRAVVADAKRAWQRSDPALRCEVCEMSFLELYGARGEGFIEAHHRIPLAALNAETETWIRDLAPVCANCHRMLHTDGGCTIEVLRGALQSAREAPQA